ncbi:hypothetical protein DENSPDRAFT_887302 [Dentipellis sp. KUC8613]|nr:hypothetical protein DENSPDRAFT_887203 [Dentipellis sp. KUC8613]KAA1480031.1 hypothetical protein DENSPDRAFT_887302 [Dentipellis sp. KUC8613]
MPPLPCCYAAHPPPFCAVSRLRGHDALFPVPPPSPAPPPPSHAATGLACRRATHAPSFHARTWLFRARSERPGAPSAPHHALCAHHGTILRATPLSARPGAPSATHTAVCAPRRHLRAPSQLPAAPSAPCATVFGPRFTVCVPRRRLCIQLGLLHPTVPSSAPRRRLRAPLGYLRPTPLSARPTALRHLNAPPRALSPLPFRPCVVLVCARRHSSRRLVLTAPPHLRPRVRTRRLRPAYAISRLHTPSPATNWCIFHAHTALSRARATLCRISAALAHRALATRPDRPCWPSQCRSTAVSHSRAAVLHPQAHPACSRARTADPSLHTAVSARDAPLTPAPLQHGGFAPTLHCFALRSPRCTLAPPHRPHPAISTARAAIFARDASRPASADPTPPLHDGFAPACRLHAPRSSRCPVMRMHRPHTAAAPLATCPGWFRRPLCCRSTAASRTHRPRSSLRIHVARPPHASPFRVPPQAPPPLAPQRRPSHAALPLCRALATPFAGPSDAIPPFRAAATPCHALATRSRPDPCRRLTPHGRPFAPAPPYRPPGP